MINHFGALVKIGFFYFAKRVDLCGCGQKQMWAGIKLFLKMCGGENFKKIRVGLSVGKVGLGQDAMNSLPCKSPNTCQVVESPVFWS